MALGATARGAGLALLAMAVFATHDVLIKTLGGRYPSHQILFFSQLLAFPLIALLLLGARRPQTLWPVQPGWVALRSVCVIISGLGAFYAFAHLPMAQVYAILFAQPLLITLFAIPLLGERVGLVRGLAVIAGLAGVLIVLRPGQAPLGLGHLAALAGAVSSALSAVLVRRLGGTERTVTLMLWPMLGNFVLTGGMLGLAYRPMPLGDLVLAGGISILGLVGGFLVITAYRTAEAAVIAPMQYSQIVWATLYGTLIFGERLDSATVIGSGVIIASGMTILMREGRGGVSATRPALGARLRAETVVAPKSTFLQRLLSRRPPPGNARG